MPTLIAALLGGLVNIVGTLVGRVLVSLGIGYVAYSGIDTAVGAAKSTAIGNLMQLPGIATQLIGILQVGTCINILCSALLARLAIKGLTSGTITRMVHK